MRRRTAYSVLLGIGLTLVSAPVATAAPAAPGAAPSAKAAAATTLRAAATHTGVRVGTAVDTAALASDPTYRAAVAAQFNTITPENVMKWEVVEPQRGQFDFTQADTLVNFARANKQAVRGHTLVWHSQLPAWVTEGDWTPAELRQILKQHVQTEVSHFRGRIWAWDVVNEAFNDDGTLRDSLWLQKLGPSYISDAFTWAHQADPKAILFYNDYNVEGINPKSDAAYALIRSLKARGVPVQGFGAQGHLGTQYGFPGDIQANLDRFGKLGLKTAITEADVRNVLPLEPAEVNAQAQGYSLMLQSCLLAKSCISYTVWGFTDKYQWVPGVFPGEGAAAIYDENFVAKPAYDTLLRDLVLAPKGKARA
jgi:endo-1,4-beta-xylanase